VLSRVVSDRLGDAVSEKCPARRKSDFFRLCLGLHEVIALLMAASSASDNLGAAAAIGMNPNPQPIKKVPMQRTLIGPSMMGSPAMSR